MATAGATSADNRPTSSHIAAILGMQMWWSGGFSALAASPVGISLPPCCVRLTRPMRAKAGWSAALLYLFCVLAPGVALALGDAASCLVHQFGAAAHRHEGAQPQYAAPQRHHELQVDQHEIHHADAGDVTVEQVMIPEQAMPGHAEHRHDGKVSPGPCCAMLCVSAITADPPAVANPAPPAALCVSEDFRRLPGRAPPLLFRPPIA